MMMASKLRPGRMVWSFVSSAVACLASGAAIAQVSTTSAVPMTHFVVQQPVDVCVDSPRAGAITDCAYINNKLQTVLSSPTGVNTVVGFIDPATGMQTERNVWSAYGIDVRQTPVVQYKSTLSQTLKINSCNPAGGTTNCTSTSFSTLAQQPDISGMTNGMSPTPTPPRNANPTIINRFFVKNICSPTKLLTDPNCTSGDVDGFGALNGNGFATQNRIFFPASTGKPDTDAHEKGHNLALDHGTFAAGGSTNLMTSGSAGRVSPTPLPPAGSKMDAWVLQVSPNAAPPSSALDQLTVSQTGANCSSLATCDNQQGAALLSGFLNATPAGSTLVCPTFGCGEGAAVQTAAASPSAGASASPPTEFLIDPSSSFSDDCFNSPTCRDASLAEVDVILTQGKFDNSSGKSFNIVFQCAGASCNGPNPLPVVDGGPAIGHGNNGNGDCQDLGPTAWCLKLKLLPGTMTLNNGGFLDFTIGTKPADSSQLAGTVCYFWESAPGVPYYSSCADFFPGFGLSSNSQMANLAMNLLIPLNFPGTPGHKPCTTDTTCPDPTHSYPID